MVGIQNSSHVGIFEALSAHPVATGYVACAVSMLTVLAALAAVLIAWSAAWPLSLAVIGAVALAKRYPFHLLYLRLLVWAAELKRRR